MPDERVRRPAQRGQQIIDTSGQDIESEVRQRRGTAVTRHVPGDAGEFIRQACDLPIERMAVTA